MTLRRSRTSVMGGVTLLVLTMSGMAIPDLMVKRDAGQSSWTLDGSMLRSNLRNAQCRSWVMAAGSVS